MNVKWMILATLILCTATAGADAADRHYIYGPGTWSCGKWVHADSIDRSFATMWLLGFISGVGQFENLGEGTDADAIQAWVDNYCPAHLLDNIAAAATDLAVALTKKSP